MRFSKTKWLQKRLATYYRLQVGDLGTFLKRTAVSHAENVLTKQIKIWNLYGCLCEIPGRIGFYKLDLWYRDRRNSGGQWEGRRNFLAGSERKNPPMVEGVKSAHRLISFLELPATYIGIRLCAPSRLENKDLFWLATPIVADNIGGRLYFEKNVYICTTAVLDVTRIGGP